MKLDGLGVILAIILLPIILVVTYYIHLQVDTVAKQNSYNTKLLSATYDAMSAFEINTANEELSSVADSMRSIILASNNVFLNSLATNLEISNASKEHLQPYIPAVLYTMYDGYYIYAPTEISVVAEKKEKDANSGLITTKGYLSYGDSNDGQNNFTNSDIEGSNNAVYGDVLYEYDKQKNGGSYKYTINKDKAKKETDYVLKSYVQYSARYAKSGQFDVTINYTLDNYLNIVGKIGDVYYTKTGYLIKNGFVTSAEADGPYSLTTHNEDEAKIKVLGNKTNANETTTPAAKDVNVTVQDQTIRASWNEIVVALGNLGYYKGERETGTGYANVRTISEAEAYLERAYEEKQATNLGDIQNLEYEIEKYKAISYYMSAAIFSNWVYDKLGNVTYGDIQDKAIVEYYQNANYKSTAKMGSSDDLYYDFTGNTTVIFDKTQDPEAYTSNFNTHKLEVIKNSIKYNLNLSISAYCKMKNSYDFSMPVLLDEEWDKILQNISIVSFMQGFDCGLSIYNNYQIVSSTNNELMVTPSEIYYVKKEEFNNSNATYHRIDCPSLPDYEHGYISFTSKEVKYDKVYDNITGIYQYDHKNLACYTCINTNNYHDISLFSSDAKSYYEKIASLKNNAKKLAGYIGIAKERQNIYKTNALPVSEGYKILLSADREIEAENGEYKEILAGVSVTNIKAVQITFAATTSMNTSGSREPVLRLRARFNSNNGAMRDIHINLDQAKEQTVVVDISDINTINRIELMKDSPNYAVEYTVKSIKAIYK